MAVILHHAANRNRKPQLLHHLQSNIHLTLSAIHHQKIRKSGKASKLLFHSLIFQLFLFLHTMSKPSGKHLLHRSIIIGSYYRLNAEFPIIAALRPSIFKDHHRAYRFVSGNIGNIKGLHSADILQPQPLSHLIHSSYGPHLFPFIPFIVLNQHKSRILLRQLHQPLLIAFLRNRNANLLTLSGAEPLANQLHILQLILHPQLLGQKWSSCIKLLYKAGKNLSLCLRSCHRHTEMIPSNQLSLPDKEYLNYCVHIIPGHSNNISILHIAAGNLLLLSHLLHTA